MNPALSNAPVPAARRTAWLLLAVLQLLLVLACSSGSEQADRPLADSPTAGLEAEPLEVVATTRPLCWLVERLAGDQARCRLFGGDEPGALVPSAEQILDLGDADLILVNGAGLESWLASASLPESRVVVTSTAVDLIHVAGETHSHGPEGEHSHERTDPHLWQDPLAMLEQARAIAPALERSLDATAVADRLGQLAGDLTMLAREMVERLGGLNDTHVAAVDPGYLYLARRAGFELREFERDPSGALGHHEREHLEEWLEGGRARLVLASPDSPPIEESLGDGFTIVELDSLLAAGEGPYDYLARLRANLEALSEAIAP